ncbi:hypothetical protein F0562_021025 [Nyssa sinensis]|uniref:Uncharacterized protein n=1 Tax=Nyssa sinensis TaxID=561372 RepID=A0A5J5BMR6_9ASTE|nr:hypothetical protein F0562_021025 [Nyssa sinensis]
MIRTKINMLPKDPFVEFFAIFLSSCDSRSYKKELWAASYSLLVFSIYLTAARRNQVWEASTKERAVLKLVHPGRYVEIHTEPITAEEVLRKNPRHCIARPDVFKFPWIVVRQESVLLPGNVFYIVPNRTIYHLLKARGQREQSSSQQNQSPKNDEHRRHPKQTAPRRSCARMTPMNENHRGCFLIQFHNMPGKRRRPQEQDPDESPTKQSNVESQNISTSQEFDHVTPEDSSVEITSFQTEVYHSDESNISEAQPENENGNLQIASSEPVNTLKSCLRKQDSVRRSQNFRVTEKTDEEKGSAESLNFMGIEMHIYLESS